MDDIISIVEESLPHHELQMSLSGETHQKSPDHDIEEYWLYVKQSILNFYNQNKLIARPVEKWSHTLNQLQKEKKYKEIENKIMQYLSLYSIDLLRLGNQYYINILITNLKRWDKLTEKYKFFTDSNNNSNIPPDNDSNIVLILLEIVYSLLKSNTDIALENLFDDIELYIIYEDFTRLIEFAVLHNKPCIIDKLIAYDYLNVINTINALYSDENNIVIHMTGYPNSFSQKRISGKKILMKIKTPIIL